MTKDVRISNQLKFTWKFALDNYPTALSVARDGSIVAVGTAEGTLNLLHANSGKAIRSVAGNENSMLAADFGKTTLATGGQDGIARIWDYQRGEQIAKLDCGGYGHWVQHIRFSPDGKTLAIATGKNIKLCDAQGKLKHNLTVSSGNINGFSFNPVGGLLAVAHGTEVSLFRVIDGHVEHTLKWASTLLNVHFSPDGRVIACGCLDKSVHFWRLGSWEDSQMAGYLSKPLWLAWSPDSKHLATTGDESVVVWNFSGKGPEGVAPIQLHGHSSPPTILASHPRKPLIISGAKDSRIVLWQPRTGGEPLGVQAMRSEIAALAFNPSLPMAYAADASAISGYTIT